MPEFTMPSPEDRFADALDALSLGLPVPASWDMSLVDAARTIGMLGAPTDGDFDHPSVPLDRATKRQIWTDLMREHGGQAKASPVPQSPGAAGSTLAPNPWGARPDPTPKRPRPTTNSLRFVPASQPVGASTFLLVIAVLALVGAAFASLAPDGGGGIFPTALATENPAQLADASPQASPSVTNGSCDPEPGWIGMAGPQPYAYDSVGPAPVDRMTDADMSNLFATFSACMDGSRYEALRSVSTERFVDELEASIAGTYKDRDGRAGNLFTHWISPLDADQQSMSFTWVDAGRYSIVFNVLPETARMLSDGRVGLIGTIAPASVSPVPDQSWAGLDSGRTLSVVFIGLVPTESGFVIDEVFGLCGDSAGCLSRFGPETDVPFASPVASTATTKP